MEKSALDLIKEYRDIVGERPPSKAIDNQTHVERRAYSDGERSGKLDFGAGRKSDYSYNLGDNEGSYYVQEYGRGYRKGWNEALRQSEERNYGKNKGKSYYDVNEDFNTKAVMFDIRPIHEFLTKRGFEDVSEEDPTIKTYVNKTANLKIYLYTDDVYWTIEDINQPDDILEDGSGANNLSKTVSHLLNMAKEPHHGKFNTCSQCDGKGCPSCEYSGEYAIGLNKDHYI